MKKVLVALLIAAMLIVPMAMFASAEDDVIDDATTEAVTAAPETTKGPKLDADGDACICMSFETKHSHEKCGDYAECLCAYDMDAIDNFVAWLKAFLGPKIADLIYSILVSIGFKVLIA